MIITHEMISVAERARACPPALAWLQAKPRTIAELVDEKPEFATWALAIPGFPDLLSGEQCMDLAYGCPANVLMFASHRLTDAQFAALAVLEPSRAMEYAHACARLTDAEFAGCVRAAPSAALAYTHARDRLTDAQVNACAATSTYEALKYAADRLSEEMIARCSGLRPDIALKFAKHRLSDRQISACEARV